MIRRLHALALAALLAVPAGAAAQQETTVILVRHAEKVTANPSDPNPGLTAEGEQRARDLANLLRDRHVAAVLTTQFARTSLTGLPTAEAAHLKLDTVPAGGPGPVHAAAVAERIRTRYAGQTVLVVGHSNTVTKIVAALGGPTLGDLCDAAYDNLFTVVIPATGTPRVTHTHYGAAAPAPAPGCVDGIQQPPPAAAP